MSKRDRLEQCLTGLYRAALCASPASFRQDFGRDMSDTFVDQLRAARSRGSRATWLFMLAALADVVLTGIREQFSMATTRARLFHLMDVRYAFRLLRRSPFFSLLTMVVLSGGLAVSIFTFSFLHTAITKPLPLRNGERIVRLEQRIGDNTRPFDAADFALLRQHVTTFSDIGVFTAQDVVVGEGDRRRVLQATITEWNLFRVAGTAPALGRTLRAADQVNGAEPVIVLGDRTWRTQFGGDTALVGAMIRINDVSTRVVGVMPVGFGFPVAADSWMPMSDRTLRETTPDLQNVDAFGQLAPGMSGGKAEAELSLLLSRARERNRGARDAREQASAARSGRAPATGVISARTETDVVKPTVVVRSFPMAQIGDEAPLVLTVLNVLAALILLLACINVMNLLLARANERARETAVRLALGASRARLIVQGMWESALLTLGGGAMAIAMAAWGLAFINRWAQVQLSGNLAFWWVWGLDRSSIMAGIVFIAATIGVLGIAVSVRATNVHVTAVLNDGSARSGGRRQGRTARVLVMAQVATVSVLMFFGVMAGIIAWRVVHVDFGYDTHRLMSASLDLAAQDDVANGMRDANGSAAAIELRNSRRRALLSRALQSLTASADVSDALLSASLAGPRDPGGTFEVRGAPRSAATMPRAYIEAVHGSLATLGMHAVAGRLLDSRDDDAQGASALISASLARRVWPGETPVGQQLRLVGIDSSPRWLTVVGVTSDVLHGNPLSRDQGADAVYVSLAQLPVSPVTAIVRHRGNAMAAEVALHRVAGEANPLAPPATVTSFDDMIGKTTLIATSTARLFALCFGFALLMAVSGTYGLMARTIGQRAREVGVRRALGASNGNVTRLLLAQGGRQLGIGVVWALPCMVMVGIGFAKFLPIGAAWTVGAGAVVVATIVGIVVTATYLPTRRVVGMGIREALWRE